MSFSNYINSIKTICYLIMILLHIAHSTQIEKAHNLKEQNPIDPFIAKILLQDTTNILDSSLPLPYYSLKYTKTYSSIKRQKSSLDPLFDEAMRAIKPTITTYDYSKLKDTYTTQEKQILANKIHELEKESYMLQAQLVLLEKKKIGWLINPERSGYYIGFGSMLGFNRPENSIGIYTGDAGAGGVVKLGYLRYFYNNIGLKAELFGIYGGISHNKESVSYSYYGLSLSFLHDIPVFTSNNYFGFFAGIGLGGYVFFKKTQSAETYSFLEQSHNLGLNLRIGASWSYTKHFRIEIERIFTAPLITLSDSKAYNFEPSYIVSYSWVF